MNYQKNRYTVLMTVYDGDDVNYLMQSLSSIENQTLKPNQVIIIVDGPIREEINNLLKSFKSKLNDYTIISLPENVGLGRALNMGLTQVKYDFIARMDSDDISKPDRFEKQINYMVLNEDLSILGTDVLEFQYDISKPFNYKRMPHTRNEVIRFSKIKDPFNHPSVVFRTKDLLEQGGYSDLRKSQDTELWLRMLSNGYFGENLDEPLLYFRFNDGTFKKRKSWINTKLLLSIKFKYFKIGYIKFHHLLYSIIRQIFIFITPIYVIKMLTRKKYFSEKET